MRTYPPKIVIEEQGLRDGLQGENLLIPTAKKLELIGAIAKAGLRHVEASISASDTHSRKNANAS